MAGFREEIVRWTREGASLQLIEERIGKLSASDEEKSALWLWAWSYRHHYRRHNGGTRGKSRRQGVAD
jgi:hypothetical protein